MEIKKVKISMKNPENYPIKGFAQVKKNHPHFPKKSIAFVILCTVLHSGQFGDKKVSISMKNPCTLP